MQDIKKTIDADANGVDRGILKKAVALEYKPNTSYDAPIVKAKGQGYVAQRIIALALEKDIPVIKNADMAEMLSALDVGEEIPPEAFVAVAQIIRYIYDSNGQELPFFES
ncbi:MAG: EscU/YscU/HrcU family type III secretion system export apparatus switch protein [Alphaproteobacteria bacterium]|nr:EscU/YscU/HrcU family type III secretion system export apparatus switch protein [Alphaproteobacteria bacterium]